MLCSHYEYNADITSYVLQGVFGSKEMCLCYNTY